MKSFRESIPEPDLHFSVCRRCGTCCRNGGPALHHEDNKLILEGAIRREFLITIRRAEWAFSPLTGRPEPVQSEVVKVGGKANGWVCYFYNEENSICSIYDRRPLECRLLKCWDTGELLSVIGKNNLTRSDLISADDPVMNIIRNLERECSLDAVEDLIAIMQKGSESEPCLSKLAELSQKDLALRSSAVAEFGLSLGDELFLFGRPLFKILSSRGIRLEI
jgi:Fe-S-cluster containining protein